MLFDGIRSSAAKSWGVKLAFGFIIIIFVFWGIGSVQAPTGVVATVNDSQITSREFQRAYFQMAQEVKQMIPGITDEQLASFNLETTVLQQLIMSKLLESESARTGINLSISEFRDAITSLPYFQKDGVFDKKLYEDLIKQSGQSVAEFEASLRSELLPTYMSTLLTSGAYISDSAAYAQYAFALEERSVDYVLFPFDASAQIVSDEELAKAYDEKKSSYMLPAQIQLEYIHFTPEELANPESIDDDTLKNAYDTRISEFSLPEQVKARHILLQVGKNAPQSEVDSVLAQIKGVESRIRAGESFEDLAKEFGQDATNAEGGDLGWFAKNQMVPSFAEAAFSLPLGELSEPVRTDFGYHLILVEDKKDATVRSFESVKDELRKNLAMDRVANSLQDIADTSLLEATNGKSFAEIATPYNLTVQSTELQDANSLAKDLGLNPANVATLMTATKGMLLDTPVALGSGLAIVRVLDINEAMPKSFEAVAEILADELAMEKAEDAAFLEASNAVKNTENLSNINSSSFFNRDGEIENLGSNILLAKEIFVSDDKNWKTTPFTLDNGVALVRLSEIKDASIEEFDAVKQNILTELTTAKKNLMFQRYISMLHAEADIKILMPELFQPKAQ